MSRILPLTRLKDFKQRHRCLQFLRFDSTIGNLPFAAILGVTLTMVGSVFISNGIRVSASVMSEYNDKASSLVDYLTYFLVYVNALHLCVLIHGLAICWLETSREWVLTSQVVCFCGKWNEECANKCQVCWAVFGSLAIFISNLCSIVFLLFSILSAFLSFIMTKTCETLEDYLSRVIEQTRIYLAQAKQHVGHATNATESILYEYNRLVSLQDVVENNAMEQVSKIETPVYFKAPVYKENIRFLSSEFDPVKSLHDGRSIISTLNLTIVQTEHKIGSFQHYADYTTRFCNDYSDLYDNLYAICIGSVLILVAHYIIIAAHYKYFSVWKYEARLLHNQDYN